MNEPKDGLSISKDNVNITDLKINNISNIAPIGTSSPELSTAHPTSTAVPIIPDAVTLSENDKEKHKQVESLVTGFTPLPQHTNKDAVNFTKPIEMLRHSIESYQSQHPVHQPNLHSDRMHHLRQNARHTRRLSFDAKIIRKNIVKVQIASHQDVSCYIIGPSGQRSSKTTVYSTGGSVRRILLSSSFTPVQLECGDNDFCTVTRRFDE